MTRHEQQTSRHEKISNFFGDSNFSKLNLYVTKRRLQTIALSFLMAGAASLWAADADSATPAVSLPSKHSSLPNENVECTIDGNSDSKLCVTHENRPVVWLCDMKRSIVPSGYSFKSANDCPARDPFKWKLEGSVNGNDWTTLDTENVSNAFAKRLSWKRFDIVNKNAYRFFRFTFEPAAADKFFQVSKIKIEEGAAPVDATSETLLVPPADGGKPIVSLPSKQGSLPNESVECTIDGNSDSKLCVTHENRPVVWLCDMKRSIVPSGYYFKSANDCPDRDPVKWTFEGSANGNDWTVLDTINAPNAFAERLAWNRFAISNRNAYRFFRFTFEPAAADKFFQISKIKIEEAK